MKTKTVDWNKQEELQRIASNSMIAYARGMIGKQELNKALKDATACCRDADGHAAIVLKGCLIKAMYALTRAQEERIHQMIENEYQPINNEEYGNKK